jgi:tRNA(fMet)-specific endonuclease VapC
MTDYLLDTNHASPLVTASHPLFRRFLRSQQSGHTFAIPALALTETLFGLGMLPGAKQNLAEWQRLMPGLTVYDVDRGDAQKAAALKIQLRRRGWQFATVDALIAAIALRYTLTLLTTDRDFSAIANLTLENWLR